MLNFDKWGRQRHNKRARAVCRAELGGITPAQVVKGSECDIAAMTVGNDELRGLRMFGMFCR